MDFSSFTMNLRYFTTIALNFLIASSDASLLRKFRTRNDVSIAINDGNYDKAVDIIARKKCDILLKDDHEALKTMAEKYYSSNGNIFSVLSIMCVSNETFYMKAIGEALLHDDSRVLGMLLSVVQHSQAHYIVGKIFKRCVQTKNIQCLETMTDWGIQLTHDGKNILHYAAEYNDLELLQFVPFDRILLDKKNAYGQTPVQVAYSREIMEALSKRWEFVTSIRTPTWESTKQMSSYLKHFSLPDNTFMQRASTFTELFPRPTTRAFKIAVRPGQIFADSFEISKKAGAEWYSPNLNVLVSVIDTKTNEVTSEISKVEWLSELISLFFNERVGEGNATDFTAPLFKQVDTDSQMYAPNGLYPDEVFKFAGSIIALALRERISLNVKLVPAAVNLLLNPEYHYNENDFALQHPELFRETKDLKMTNNRLGIEQIYQKVLKMSCNAVSSGNLDECTNDIGNTLCYFQFASKVSSLGEGFRLIHSKAKLANFFSATEMTALLEGGDVDLQSRDFLEHCKIIGSSKQIFIEMVNGLNAEELRFFYQILTGRDSIPIEGVRGLPEFKVQLEILPEGALPAVSPGSSTICFPAGLASSSAMKEKLFELISHQFQII